MTSTDPTVAPGLERQLSTLPRAAALGAIVVAVSLLAGWLLSPSLSSHHVPVLTSADVGTPFRGSSVAGFKAPRDVEVLDEAATQHRRDEARARVRPVFDHAPAVARSVEQAVRLGFGLMRDAAERAGRPPADGVQRKPDEVLLRALAEARPEFTALLGVIEDDDFIALASARFSLDVESELVALLAEAYRFKLVATRRELARVDAQGITVREVGGDAEVELQPAPREVVDLGEASGALERSAPGPQPLRRALVRLAQRQLRPDLTINIAETEARRVAAASAVKPVRISVKRGQRVVGDGELVTHAHVLVAQGLRAQLSERDLIEAQLGSAGLVAVLISAAWLFFRSSLRRFRPLRRDALFMAMWGLALLGALQGWVQLVDRFADQVPAIHAEAWHYLFPAVAGAMLVRFVVSAEASLYFALVFSLLAGALLGNAFVFSLSTLLGSLVAAERVGQAGGRLGVVRAGAVSGLFGGAMVLFVSLATGRGLGPDALASAGATVVGSTLVAPLVVLLLTPLTELVFGYVSNVKLIDLANLNHPALKELVLHAPGTYQHALIVGVLAERAAQAIGANVALAKAGAYYHDLGKVQNPAFFGENQKADNPHDGLAPLVSAQAIRRHVADGVDRARRFGLPRRVIDIIEQHHGTRRLEAFWGKARRADDATALDDGAFRYPGPRPRSTEAALVMVADTVEAASRGMSEPTLAHCQTLAGQVIDQLVLDGQFVECDISLQELRVAAGVLAATLDELVRTRAPPAAVLKLVKTAP